MFIGRNEELETLENEFKKDHSFCCVYGTRRIGKTSLIQKFVENKNCIFFQAKEASGNDNLRSLSEKIGEKLNRNDEYIYSSYEKAFNAAISSFNGEKGILVIDEYPYLVKTNSSISSIIQDIYDNQIIKSKIMLILAGSNLSFMEKELNDKQSPLYKRCTLKMKIKKMNFDEAKLFVKDYPTIDQAKFLSVFGPFPYYLSMIDTNLSFDDNIKKLFFDKTSILLDAPKNVLSNATREQSFYNSILAAITTRKRTLNEISDFMKEEATKINKYMKTLLNCELVIKKEMFNSTRISYYEISDPVICFYYKFIANNIEKIEAGFGSIIYERLKEQINLFISLKFEDVSILYIEELNRKGYLDGIYYPIQKLIIENSELERSIEIDGIAKDGDSLLVIECKFRNEKRGVKDFNKMKENMSIKMLNKYKKINYIIVSRSGFTKELIDIKPENLTLLDVETMFS